MLKIKLTLYDLIPEMVKHNPTIRWLLQTSCLSLFDHSVESSLKGLRARIILILV